MAVTLDERSIELRQLVIDSLEAASRGHLGSSFSLMEILRVLYDDIMRYEPSNPCWKGRDRFILSKGHGCLAQYAFLADKGFIPHSDLQEFCQTDGLLGGHPDGTKVPGVECSTGSLGHGPAIGAGQAFALKAAGSDARVFVVLGDGECNEGSVWETAMLAAQQKLDNLILLVDYNKYQSYDQTAAIQDLEPFADKWRAFGFDCVEVNGHDVDELKAALEPRNGTGKPLAVICHTVKGKGYAPAENNLAWHHKSKISEEEITAIRDGVCASGC